MNKHIIQYIESQNFVARFMNERGADLRIYDPADLTITDRKVLLDRLESDLSPENLTCDGEIQGAKLRTKETMLKEAQRYLKGME